jgi:hypothetical protein
MKSSREAATIRPSLDRRLAERADIRAKRFEAQWWEYDLYLFWF